MDRKTVDRKTTRIGKRGTVVIPAEMRRLYGIEEGDLVIAEGTDEGILLRPAAVVPLETYTLERKAEFLLSNAVDASDYARAREEVRRLGLDPARIRHERPAGAGSDEHDSDRDDGADDATPG